MILNHVVRVDLPTLLKESDVVSLQVVLTRKTRHMIRAGELALMKQDAVLINTSRARWSTRRLWPKHYTRVGLK